MQVTHPKDMCLSLDSQVALSTVTALRQQKIVRHLIGLSFHGAGGEKRSLGSPHVVGLPGWTLKQRLSRSICLLAVREERVSLCIIYRMASVCSGSVLITPNFYSWCIHDENLIPLEYSTLCKVRHVLVLLSSSTPPSLPPSFTKFPGPMASSAPPHNFDKTHGNKLQDGRRERITEGQGRGYPPPPNSIASPPAGGRRPLPTTMDFRSSILRQLLDTARGNPHLA